MKKFKNIFLVAMVLLTGVVIAANWTTGDGTETTATTDVVKWEPINNVNTLSISNMNETNKVYALVNISTNDFSTRLAANSVVCIPGGEKFVFDAREKTSIESVCYATTNGTASIVIGAY